MSCCGGPKDGKPFDPECEGPSASDMERFGGDGAICPSCGADVYHDAAICNACGEMIEDRAAKQKTWVVATAVVALVAFVLVFVI